MAGVEGQQLLVKNEKGEAEVYIFDAKEGWQLMGVVTNAKKKNANEGKKFVFPVELDGKKYELGYSPGDNIYEVAEKFPRK